MEWELEAQHGRVPTSAAHAGPYNWATCRKIALLGRQQQCREYDGRVHTGTIFWILRLLLNITIGSSNITPFRLGGHCGVFEEQEEVSLLNGTNTVTPRSSSISNTLPNIVECIQMADVFRSQTPWLSNSRNPCTRPRQPNKSLNS